MDISRMENKKRVKQLGLNTLVFAIGMVGSKGIQFLLIPFLTKYLSTSEYGTVDFYITVVSLLVPVISVSIYDSVLRYASDLQEDNRVILSSSIYFLKRISIIVIIMAIILSAIFHQIIVLLVALNIIFLFFNSTFSQYVKARNKNILFSIQSLVLSSLNLITILIILPRIDWKVSGYFFCQILSLVIVDGILYWSVYKDISKKLVNTDVLKRLIRYGIPLIPNQLMWWLMNASNRFVIIFFLGASANGLFAVANKVPTLIGIFTNVFIQAWQVNDFQNGNTTKSNEFFSKVMNLFLTLLVLGSTGVIIFSEKIIKLVANVKFIDAWKLVPILMLALFFSNISIFLGTKYLTNMNTKKLFSTSVIGGVLNIIFNVVLIPQIGINGAAISMVLSYIVVCIIRFVDINRESKIEISFFFIISSIALLVLISFFVINNYEIYFIIISLIGFILLNIKSIVLSNIKLMKG